ncbi:MAG: T9SS type A sorting domain-containing protein, partial [Flavobacteriia bacterium]
QYEYYDLSNDNMPVFTYSFVSIKQANSATALATQTAVLSSVQPTLTAGLETKKENNFVVYPNPSQGSISLKGNLNNSSAIITDMRGRIMKELKNIHSGQQIDLTDLQHGSYFITIETDGKRTTQKLFLQ